jgi:hypothetical protein
MQAVCKCAGVGVRNFNTCGLNFEAENHDLSLIVRNRARTSRLNFLFPRE